MREHSKKLSILLNTIHRRVFRIGPMFVLARFRSCRVSYSYLQRVRQSADRRRHQTPQSMFQPLSESFFEAIDADRSVEELRKDGISLHFDLPPALVNEIYNLACSLPLQNSVRSRPFFKSEVTEGGRLPDGQLVSLGTAYKSRKLQLLNHECVSRVVNDPVLLKVVSGYLGYWPKRLSDLELYWSYATGLSVEEQMRQGNAIDYHFDLHGYNFVMAAFYITDTDRTSGAHVMFKNSHKKKTLPMLFSYSQPADVLRRQYGSENETIIEGKAGTGFVMDNSTYHRATTPESADRLLLRLVYT
ncbi:hypothetical protein [Methylobacterium sp. 1030]|uniref:hypothetical protein n=1 Tax=Methylobacterium sp. 1030 TaxID=3156404 RepID=UPI0033993385